MGVVGQTFGTETLSEALKKRTAAAHTAAERSGVVNDILRKKADRHGYGLLLRSLVPAYRAMEAALEDNRDRPLFKVFASHGLYRAPRLESDLVAIAGPDWERDLPLLASATRYADAVTEAAKGDGGRLVAHAYVRYFGDLSGGQIMKRMLGAALALTPDESSFYDFPDIADHADFKNAMRQSIDVDVAAHCDIEGLLDEAVAAFEHNIAISNEIQQLQVRGAVNPSP